MKIVLLGYMASGKSIIAKELAKKTNLKWIDLDFYIEEKENLKIQDIFKIHGEIRFRTLENKYLKELLTSKSDFILSLGGGTPCYANNLQIIQQYSKSIFLKASIDTLFDRLINDKDSRPLISNIAESILKEFIAKHLFERNQYYNMADIIYTVDNKNVNEIVNDIIKLNNLI